MGLRKPNANHGRYPVQELHILQYGQTWAVASAPVHQISIPASSTLSPTFEAEVDRMVDVTLRLVWAGSVLSADHRTGKRRRGRAQPAGCRFCARGVSRSRSMIFGADDSDSKRWIDLKSRRSQVRRGMGAPVLSRNISGHGITPRLMVETVLWTGITGSFRRGFEEDHQVEFCQKIGVQLMQGICTCPVPEIVPPRNFFR